MTINFGQLGAAGSADSLINPRDIFSVLPAKDAKYQYPRDVQAEVWRDWFERRNERDLIVKMNTGGGKTVVGLLMLKSSLNDGAGPAIYVAPDPYLVGQVVEEATKLGLEVTTDKSSVRVLRGKSILVISIKELINGLSTFGVGDEGIKIPIGSLVVDDAHACLGLAESQFTIRIEGDSYEKIFAVFRDALYQQSATLAMEVEGREPYKQMLVPFWSWIDNSAAVGKILMGERGWGSTEEERKKDQAKFTWPLLKHCLPLCRCVIGGGAVEISPPVLPISVIPAIGKAKRRIYMSATIADDSVLVSHFDLAPEAAARPISPSTAGDIGDRMIFVPQELNTDLTDDAFKAYMAERARSVNVVVLVPSHHRAKFWQSVANQTLTAENLQEGVRRLKQGHVGLVVIVNRYDGIDLPHEACRILVVDGLPDVRRKIDKHEESVLLGSESILTQRIQRIEQGMGRGVRSNDDYCVVFLVGRTLTNFLYAADAQSKFTDATKAQMNLSDRLGEQLRGKPLSDINEAVNQCLGRNSEWVGVSRGMLVGLRYKQESSISDVTIARRRAFNAAAIGDFTTATAFLQEAVSRSIEPVEKGWLKAQLAEMTYHVDSAASQSILKSAVALNSRVTHPLDGIVYDKLLSENIAQAQRCAEVCNQPKYAGNKLMIAIHGMLDELVFLPETAPVFEEAFKNLARFLGFSSQRPENDYKRGPDVLWEMGGMNYLVIECKNGATNDESITKYYCNQLNGSMNWFFEKYGTTPTVTPVMVHPINTFEYASQPHDGTRVITFDKLEELKNEVRALFVAIVQGEKRQSAEIAELLPHYGLTPPQFIDKFTLPFRVKGLR